MDLERQYNDRSHSHSYSHLESSSDGSAEGNTRRTTLGELMQLSADCELPSQNSSVSQIKTSEPLDFEEQENLKQLEAVPKQYKRWGIWKSTKVLSWSSAFKPRDAENNKPQRNSNNGVFAKVIKLWKKKETPQCERKIERTSPGTESSDCSTWSESRRGNEEKQENLKPQLASPTCGSCDEEVCSSPRPCGDHEAGLLSGCGNDNGEDDLIKPCDGVCSLSGCGNLKVVLVTSTGAEHDNELSCGKSVDFDEKQTIEEKELVEEGDKEGWKTSSFDTQEVEKDVNEESMRILQQEDPTHLDVGKTEMREESNHHMLARSSSGGSTERSAYQNAAALASAEFGSPVSTSRTWEVFELIDVWNAQEEKMWKQAAEDVPKEHKDKRRPWSSLLKPRVREYKQKVVSPRDKQDVKPPRKNKIGVLPRGKENNKPERINKHIWCVRQGNEPVLADRGKEVTQEYGKAIVREDKLQTIHVRYLRFACLKGKTT